MSPLTIPLLMISDMYPGSASSHMACPKRNARIPTISGMYDL